MCHVFFVPGLAGLGGPRWRWMPRLNASKSPPLFWVSSVIPLPSRQTSWPPSTPKLVTLLGSRETVAAKPCYIFHPKFCSLCKRPELSRGRKCPGWFVNGHSGTKHPRI